MNFKAIGDYKVYEDGTVVSVKGQKEKVLNPMTTRTGYKHVQLRFGKYGNSYMKDYTVHRLVATLFIPNPEGFNEIDHIDGDKANNAAYNLRWISHKDNCNNPATVKNMLGETPYVRVIKSKKKLKDGTIKEYKYIYGNSLQQ